MDIDALRRFGSDHARFENACTSIYFLMMKFGSLLIARLQLLKQLLRNQTRTLVKMACIQYEVLATLPLTVELSHEDNCQRLVAFTATHHHFSLGAVVLREHRLTSVSN